MARRLTTARRPAPEVFVRGQAAAALLAVHRDQKRRAEGARRRRIRQAEENWNLYFCRQDWSHKQSWQSRIFLPDFPVAVDQIVATLKRGLTDADDWLTADLPGLGDAPALDQDMIKFLLLFYLDRLHDPGNRPESASSLASRLGDGLLHAIMEGTITAKVYAVEQEVRRYRIERHAPVGDDTEGAHVLYEFGGQVLRRLVDERVRIAIDILPVEAYLPDPSPAHAFDGHRVRRTLGELAQNPEYDPATIERLYGRAQERAEDRTTRRTREAEPTGDDHDPFVVTLDEWWGDVVDRRDGTVLARNVLWTVGDDELLREPVPNPNWHAFRPFVSTSLMGLRKTTTQPALADRAADLTRARNELESLMLDGGLAEVWGVRQLRPDLLEDDSDVQDGVAQNATLILKPNVPPGSKALERLDSGSIPQLALEMKRDLDASLQGALATPDTKLGQLPPRQVKATEIVEAMQAAGSLFESIAAVLEDEFLEPLFELVWQTLWQYVDDIREPELVQILGPDLALRLHGMSAAERFTLLRDTKFRVRGLRGVAVKGRTFSKIDAMLARLAGNPAMADIFDKTMSIPRLLEDYVRASGLEPARYRLRADEGPQLDPTLLSANGGTPAGPVTAAADQVPVERGFAPNTPQPGGPTGAG